MPKTSPLMNTALVLLKHGIEHYVKGENEDFSMAVLHVTNAIEICLKGVLVKNNISIYEKEGKTITIHNAFKDIKKLWGIPETENVPCKAKIELLIDERNSIQHRYGAVDQVAMDYYLGTAIEFFEKVFEKEYAENIHEVLTDIIDKEVYLKCRFIKASTPEEEEETVEVRVKRLADYRPYYGFMDLFSKLETVIYEETGAPGLKSFRNISTLDVSMKFLKRISDQGGRESTKLFAVIPEFYRARNSIVHGGREVVRVDLDRFLEPVLTLINLMESPDNKSELQDAIKESYESEKDKGKKDREIFADIIESFPDFGRKVENTDNSVTEAERNEEPNNQDGAVD